MKITRAVEGETAAAALAAHLIRASTPFAVEPYPDDMWMFTVKKEAERFLPKDVLGFCRTCFRVRWLAVVDDFAGMDMPHGKCRTCEREERQGAAVSLDPVKPGSGTSQT